MKSNLRDRPNGEWLAALRSPERSGAAASELRGYLRAVLSRLARSGSAIDEAELEDFTQDTLVRVLRGLDTFRGDCRFTTWATAVAVRVVMSARRRRSFRERAFEGFDSRAHDRLFDPAAREPGRELDRTALFNCLRYAIHHCLSDRQRRAIIGALSGFPSSALAERLETSSNALYKLHHDARKKLKRVLNEEGFTDEQVRQELLSA